MHILLIPHLGKAEAIKISTDILDYLIKKSIDVTIYRKYRDLLSSTSNLPPNVNCIDDDDSISGIDIAIIIGGDGAMLSASRVLAPRSIPMLGVNTGRLGFITQVEVKDIYHAIDRLMKGNFVVEQRMMLNAYVTRAGCTIGSFLALNDIVITKGALARIVSLKTFVNCELVTTYRADGLIIATPTGSTAYSLSAGGPIVNPSINAILITPICAHTLNARAILASGDEIVNIELESNHNELMLTADGQIGFEIQPKDRISVKSAPFPALLVNVMNRGIYTLLRERISDGRL